MSARDIVIDCDLLAVLDSIDAIRNHAIHLLQQQQHTLDAVHDGSISDPRMLRPAKQQSRIISQASQLRGVYRTSVMSTRMTKQITSNARAEVDKLHLQLQNLTYEQSHLKGEIAACEGYAHKYADLPLIPETQFHDIFPETKGLDAHPLTIARIEHEHVERQALEEKRQGLLKHKQGLIAENNRRKEDLANLDKDLEKFIEVADPIIKTFEKEY